MHIFSAFMLTVFAGNLVTKGDGTTYTLESLAQIEGSGVVYDTSTQAFTMRDTVTIATGDKFVYGDHVKRLLITLPATKLIINGEADFRSNAPTEIHYNDQAETGGESQTSTEIIIDNGDATTRFSNVDFRHVGISARGQSAVEIDGCTFNAYNGTSGGAVYMANSTGRLTVSNCIFQNNQKPAIGNSYGCQNITLIENCQLFSNALNNANTRQINLVASDSVTVRGCCIYGDESLTMVGGIGVSNWTAAANRVVVFEDNIISGNRYGVTTLGPTNLIIRNNKLTDNNRETNANNGGSGISIYDPYYRTAAKISGNEITGNLWGVTIIGGGDINLGKIEVEGSPLSESDEDYCAGNNVFNDNGNNGILYALYNNGTAIVYAQNNQWSDGEQTQENIEGVIFHKNDDPSLGEVIFMPPMQADNINTIEGRLSGNRQPNGVYNLRGIKVAETETALPHGYYIVRKGGKTTKIVK